MNKVSYIKRVRIVFKHFSHKGYALFSCLGKEVLIGVLSVPTLSYAKADGIAIQPLPASDSLIVKTVQQIDEVEVMGSRAPLTRSQQARMVTVLTRDEIAAAPVQSVNDLLKYAVGVDVRQRGPIGAQTDISIRGGNSEQITVLLNGININDPQTGHNAFDFPVALADIERIEILEGPAGRVYGTSSLVGAINIVTKMPQRTSADVQVEGGSYGYASAAARGNLYSGSWNHSLSASYTRSDGYSRSKAGRLNADYKTGKAFYQGLYQDPNIRVKWHAGLSVKDFGSNTFYGLKWDDQFEHTFKTYTAIQAENRAGAFHLRPSIYWNRNMDRFELFRGKPDTYPYNYHRTDVYGLNLNSYFDWRFGRTAFGAELRNEDLVSGNLGEPLASPRHIHGTDRDYAYGFNRTNINFVLEHNVLLERFTLSAGLTAAKNSAADMNMRVYPGADATWCIGDGWKVYGSFNTSLRMPSVTELFYSVGGHKADSHLKPEELSALEAGVEYRTDVIEAKASVYRNRRKNLIDWIRDTKLGPDAEWTSVNFGRVNSFGAEASATVNFMQWLPSQHVLQRLKVAYGYMDQQQKEEDGIQSKYALEYLRHHFVAGLQLSPLAHVLLNINYRYQDRVGSYTDVSGNVVRYSPYGVVDARLSWDRKRWQFYIEADNLTGKDYVDYGNVPQPSAWITAGLRLQL